MAIDNISFRGGSSVYLSKLNSYSYEMEEKISKEVLPEVNEVESPKAPARSNPNEFTFDFKKGNDFNLVGATNKMEDVDIVKAMSDMKKEDVLSQYKFFVGSANLGTDEDGTVRIVNK